MWLFFLFFALDLPGLTPVFTLEDSDDLTLASPVDAVLFEDRLYIVDNGLMQLLVVHLPFGEIHRTGRKGEGPQEFKFWPERILIREPDQIQINEWNNLREHRYDLEGNHLGMEPFNAARRVLYERRGQILRRLGYNEALEKSALWENGFGTKQLIGALPEKHLFYNLSMDHSMADIGEDDTVAIMNHGGQLYLYRGNEEINAFHFPVEHLKADVRIDQLRSGFLTQMGHPDHKAYLGKAPILDFAIQNKGRVWALAKNEHANNTDEGDQEVWLFDANLANQSVEKTQIPFEPTYIRYDYGHLILISKSNASIHVYRVETQ